MILVLWCWWNSFSDKKLELLTIFYNDILCSNLFTYSNYYWVIVALSAVTYLIVKKVRNEVI